MSELDLAEKLECYRYLALLCLFYEIRYKVFRFLINWYGVKV